MEDDLIAEDELKAALEEHARLEPPKKRPCRELLQKYASTIRKEINRGFTIDEMYQYLMEKLGIKVSLRTFKRYLQAQDVKKSSRKGNTDDVKKVKAAPAGESKIPAPETEQEKPAEGKDDSPPATTLHEETHSSLVTQPPALPPQTENGGRSIGVAAYDPTKEL